MCQKKTHNLFYNELKGIVLGFFVLRASVLKMNTTDNNDSVITSILDMQYSSLYYINTYIELNVYRNVCVCKFECMYKHMYHICHTTRAYLNYK